MRRDEDFHSSFPAGRIPRFEKFNYPPVSHTHSFIHSLVWPDSVPGCSNFTAIKCRAAEGTWRVLEIEWGLEKRLVASDFAASEGKVYVLSSVVKAQNDDKGEEVEREIWASCCMPGWLSFSFARRLTYHPSQKMQRSDFYGNCLKARMVGGYECM